MKNLITYSILLFLALSLAGLTLSAEENSLNSKSSESGEVFVRVYPGLEDTLELVDEQHDLPDSSWFGSDKDSHQKKIDELLDEAIDALELETVRRYREEMQDNLERIQESQERVATYRRERLNAPDSPTLGMEKLPFLTTKSGYDSKIDYEKDAIKRLKEAVASTKRDFRKALSDRGLELEPQEFDVLLSTINGEDFIEMKVAFDTVKKLTKQLETLTEESGEDVHTAKRYFGMYTVLLRMLDRIQQNFVRDIHEKHLPQIDEYEEAARRNISEAESALEKGANRVVLEQNIESNKMTLQALALYRTYLGQQERTVGELNAALRTELLAADNTYNTVSLATQVVDLLRTGIRNFDLLLKLEPPPLSGFSNSSMRSEISKLTELMRREKS